MGQVAEFVLINITIGLAVTLIACVVMGMPVWSNLREWRGLALGIICWPMVAWILWVYITDRSRFEAMMRELNRR